MGLEQDETYRAWCTEQGLDEACFAKLMELTPEQRETVRDGFSPKPGTQNPSGLFVGYLRSIVQSSKGGGKSKGKGYAESMCVTAPAAWSHNDAVQDQVAQFVLAWDLDEECATELLKQQEHVIYDVVNGFAPRPGTANVRSLFFGYVKSVASGGKSTGKGTSKGVAWPGQWEMAGNGRSHGKDAASFYGAKGAMTGKGRAGGHSSVFSSAPPQAYGAKSFAQLQEEISNFAAYWSLDEDCVQQLMQQSPEVIGEVLEGFAPKSGTMNVRSLFVGYLKSVVAGSFAGSHGGKAESGYGKGWGATARAGPYSRQPPQESQIWPLGKGYASKGKDFISQQDLADFVSYWGLDQTCLDYLVNQAADIQLEAVNNFRPKSGTGNVSGLFVGYLNSLVRSSKGGKGKK
eukprot:TRINITY_DN5189_c0_g1_i1.p1 TRINITY_DN5189_c0_g1~~TRINITY_DN5189_c0_g1_i1.p1  ORF type:complete len:410 (-),score=107.36 TRINITY_DN5189_c0_g1_i1:30-1238(-)